VEVMRDRKIYAMDFERGQTARKLQVVAEVKSRTMTGTCNTFLPDAKIFRETIEFKAETILAYLHELTISTRR
jgi:DNA gyrase subunit B